MNYIWAIDMFFAMADSPKRPLGVSIIGILYLLVGLLEFLAGLALLAASAATIVDFQGLSAGMVMALGGFVMLVGLIDLLIAAGCFKGWGWIWTLAVIFTIIC